MPKVKPNPSRAELEANAEAHRQAELDVEKRTVLAQPHRAGDHSDMTDPLGMFVRLHMVGMFVGEGAFKRAREAWEGGFDYFRLVYRWRVAKGIPVPLRLFEGVSSGVDMSDPKKIEEWEETVRDWGRKIKRCENAMKCSGKPGFEAAQKLILDGEFPEMAIVGPVTRAIFNLAMELGRF